jgi:hypothetical protein
VGDGKALCRGGVKTFAQLAILAVHFRYKPVPIFVPTTKPDHLRPAAMPHNCKRLEHHKLSQFIAVARHLP